MTYKVFERKDKSSSKGTPLIFILQPGGIKIPTGLHCKPGSWNQESQSVLITGKNKDPLGQVVNSKLRRSSILLQELLDKSTSIPDIRKVFKRPVAVEDKTLSVPISNLSKYEDLTTAGKTFFKQVDQVIHSHASDWTEGYKKRFRTIRTKILEYEPQFRIEMLTEEWWRGFVTHCIDELENVSNTVNTDAKTIQALMKELDIPGHNKISWAYIEPQVKGLTWDKVLKLDSSEVIAKVKEYPKATLNDSRILWLAGAYTGRRWTEISTVGPENFYQKGTEWRYKNIGKGNKLVDIPLLDEAIQFFKKLKFKLPELTNQTVNEDIKIVCRLAGYKEPTLVITPISASKVLKEVKEEWQTIHYHTGRHSFGQRVAQMVAGEPHADKVIAMMLGHASYQTSWKYMNQSQDSNETIFKRAQSKINSYTSNHA